MHDDQRQRGAKRKGREKERTSASRRVTLCDTRAVGVSVMTGGGPTGEDTVTTGGGGGG